VAALIEKPTAARKEAACLEVHEAALLLESARTWRGSLDALGTLIVSLTRDGGWQCDAAELLTLVKQRWPASKPRSGWPRSRDTFRFDHWS